MDNNEKFTNRPLDKMSMKKSKEYLWKFIESKTLAKEKVKADESANFTNAFSNFFRSFFNSPRKFAPAGIIAGLVIAAIIFTNFSGGLFKTTTVHAAFEMTADEEDAAGVESDSSFILNSSVDYEEDVIEENLKVSPEVEFEVDRTGEGEYEIKPKDNLEGNKVYNFTIISTVKDEETGKEKQMEYSWAYQVKDTFKVLGNIPSEKGTSVPLNSGIEISFSHENFDFDNIEDYFEVSPNVKGKFEKHRNVLVFVPRGGLQPATVYTVKVKEGLPVVDSDKKLEENFIMQFETDMPGRSNNDAFSFVQDYYEIGSESAVAFDVYNYTWEKNGKTDVTFEVFKYKNTNEYLDALNAILKFPSWTYRAKELHLHETDKLQKLGSFEGIMDKKNWKSYVYLPKAEFDPGYYLFQVDVDGRFTEQALVQITDLSSYTSISATDTLIWVNDLETGKPVKDAKVQIGQGGDNFETDADGVARFETPEAWKTVGYENQASDILKITGEDGKTLITKISTLGYEMVPYEYWKIFNTDRPVYKSTDEVNYFGMLKPKNSGVDTKDLKLRLMYQWDSVFVKELPFELNDDGTFKGKLDIKNYSPGYYNLKIVKDDVTIANAPFEVADYVKPAYNITVTADKNAVFSGEKMNFKTKAAFFDGTPVPNLTLSSERGDKKTDVKGELTENITAQKEAPCEGDYCYDIHDYYYYVNSKLGEETDIYSEETVRIFDSKLYLNTSGETIEKDGKLIGKINVKANSVDLTKLNANEDAAYDDFIGEEAAGKTVEGKIKEITWNKVEIGEYYDFVEKQVMKDYEFRREEKELRGFSVYTDGNGEANFEFELKPDSYYIVHLQSPDDEGNMANSTTSVYGYAARSSEYPYYQMQILNGEKDVSTNAGWWWSTPIATFDIGEEVKSAMSQGEIPINEKGHFLFLQLSNGLQEYEVQDSAFYNFEFGKADVPNIILAGVWFDGEGYKTTAWSETSVYFKKDLAKLNIEVESDKEKYEPGEEVKLSVNVTDDDGKPAAATVNFNLVDEAYYKAAYDNFIDPLDELYSSVSEGVFYKYSTHANPLGEMSMDGGKGGCFTGETQILMADGTTKAIKNIKEGDVVLTKLNEYSSELVPAEVKGSVSHFVSEYLVVNEDLEVTPEHIVFVNGKWLAAGDIKYGDSMLGKNGEEIKIFSIRKVVEPVWVYNFEVEDQHTYFANGFYVHNSKDGDMLRDDFEDTALFEVIETDAKGQGEIKFKLPDNITSWRVVTKAIDIDNLRAGHEIGAVKVTLPFFADIVANDEYSVKDEPLIKVRTYGEQLKENDGIKYEVALDGKDTENLEGKAFEGNYYKLPKLELGKHQISVKAESGKSSDSVAKDTVVKGSRLNKNIVDLIEEVNEKTVFDLAKSGATQIKLLDSGVAQYYQDLWEMYYMDSGRLDKRMSSLAAAELLNKYFEEGLTINKTEAENLITTHQRESGMSLLPYSSPDLQLTALLLSVDSNIERYDELKLRDYFYSFYKDNDANLSEVVWALSGLAALDEPVLLSLRAIQEEEKLSLIDKLYIALAFENLGSKSEAKEIYQNVFGELAEGDDEANLHATALGAVVAAGLQENEAAGLLWDYVELNQDSNNDVFTLYKLGYVKNSLELASTKPVKFKVKLNDHSEEVTLEKWEDYSLMAFEGDIVAVSVIEGELGAVLNYSKAVEPNQLATDNSLKISRKYLVNGVGTTTFNEGDLVEVIINVEYSGRSSNPIFSITDILPSGLKPVANPIGIYGYFSDYISYPYSVNGQELKFGWYPWHKDSSITDNSNIRYFARVVAPGKYYADPAKIEHFDSPELVNITPSATVEIKPAQ